MTPITKMIAVWVVLVAFAGAAFAQTGSPQPPSTPGPAAPSMPDPRKVCAAAMNADPQFAADIIKVADEKAAKQRDTDTLAAHTAADAHVQKNERQVIYAYAAMWIVAALFVIFLWRRQQALQAEIANLRRDLEASADGSAATKERT